MVFAVNPPLPLLCFIDAEQLGGGPGSGFPGPQPHQSGKQVYLTAGLRQNTILGTARRLHDPPRLSLKAWVLPKNSFQGSHAIYSAGIARS